MALGVELIDVNANVREEFDWSDLSPGVISDSSWSISPQGPVLSQPLIQGLLTSVEVSGCLWGRVYRLVNIVMLTTGESEVQSIAVYGGRE